MDEQQNATGMPTARMLYHGDDAAALHAFTNQLLAPHDMVFHDSRPLRASFAELHSGRIAVYDLAFGTDVVLDGYEGLKGYIACIGHRGRAALTYAGSATPFSPSISSPGPVVSSRLDADTTTRLICLPRVVVDNAARVSLDGDTDTSLAFEPLIDTRRPETQAWLRLAHGFARGASGYLAASPLAVGHYEQLLVHALVALQPHNRARAGGNDVRPVTRGVLRRAMVFCEDNIDRPIQVADMAAAARVSVRTLQNEFRRRLDQTPLQYLRDLRLANAHADLRAIASGQAAGSVAEVAARWGFPERRYFTTMYARAYGQLPSDTMRRGGTADTPTVEGRKRAPAFDGRRFAGSLSPSLPCHALTGQDRGGDPPT
ncbi:AraC family transcriptional regulator [Streptodolium elevatio]|uniref:AraC family transcriptional regulator n=1 Tax=Streptodolium elevatio TaxID=3157996 RepID=A0ABV3DMR3_9ACTN